MNHQKRYLKHYHQTEREFWIEAIEKELGELDERGVFDITENQEGPGMKSKMFYKFKYDQNLNPVYKARLLIMKKLLDQPPRQ